MEVVDVSATAAAFVCGLWRGERNGEVYSAIFLTYHFPLYGT